MRAEIAEGEGQSRRGRSFVPRSSEYVADREERDGSSRGSRTCSASARRPAASARTCSRPGGCSSSGSPSSTAGARLRGHAVGGRRAARLHRVPARVVALATRSSSLTLARPELPERRPAGCRQAQLHALSLEPLSRRRWRRCSTGSSRAPRGACGRRSWHGPRGCRLCGRDGAHAARPGLLERDGDRYRPTGPIEALDVPETLHALIAARLDGLAAEERQLLQDASVLGKTFTKQALRPERRGEEPFEPCFRRSSARRCCAPGRPALARARPVRLPPGPAQARRLRDARAPDRKGRHLAAAVHRAELGPAEEEIAGVVSSHYSMRSRPRPRPTTPQMATRRGRCLPGRRAGRLTCCYDRGPALFRAGRRPRRGALD